MSRSMLMILFIVLLAVLLMLVALPTSWQMFRPEWVVLVLIYWILALPHRVGVILAWCIGLLMDVLLGTHLGLLAFSYAFVAYLVLKFYLQLRQYPLLQQTLPIIVLVLFVKLIAAVMAPGFEADLVWGPAVMSAILWPGVFKGLRWLRRQFHIR